MKHSVDYIRALQRILNDYDDFSGAETPDGLPDLCPAPSPSTPSSCSSPSLYTGDAESGYGSPPLSAHHHHQGAAAFSPVQLSPPPIHREGGYPNHHQRHLSPATNNRLPQHVSSSNNIKSSLHLRLSPGSQGGAQQRLPLLSDKDNTLNVRLSPGINCSGGPAPHRLSQDEQPPVFPPLNSHHHHPQLMPFNTANQSQAAGGASGSGVFPSLRPFPGHPQHQYPAVRPLSSPTFPSKGFSWQVGLNC